MFSNDFGSISSPISPFITPSVLSEPNSFLATIKPSVVIVYSSSGFNAIPVFAGSVQGVVVQIITDSSLSFNLNATKIDGDTLSSYSTSASASAVCAAHDQYTGLLL